MNEVILNWLPPAVTAWPSPSMSILKTFLESHNTKTEILYWNTILDDILKDYLFIEQEPDDELGFLSLFYAQIAMSSNDKSNILKQKIILQSIKPQYRNNDNDYFKKHIESFVLKLEKRIKKVLSETNFTNCLVFGMSMNLFQWIPASVIAKLLKEIHPNIKICIGGIGTKEAAIAYLKNFKEFDYAIWGEGEFPLLNLIDALKNREDLDDIAHLVYRNNLNKIQITTNKKSKYLDLNAHLPIDYSDFFNQTNINIEDRGIPIEGSRGCHWLKCKFCFLNDGYRYRTKEPETIVNEIRHIIKTYNIYKFQFLDNDVIGKDLVKFDELLDLLLQLKQEFPKFEIFLAEIITKGLNTYYIKKMSLAGFCSVQIGYESPSNSLLRKINKKNTFASNLLFIKWANTYNININGLNILRGLLEESEEDILESINNLHFLRFVLTKNHFQHNISQLAIGKSSRYYDEVIKSKDYNNYNDTITEFLSEDIIREEDRDTLLFSTRNKQSLYWGFFEKTENYYLENKFEYTLVSIDNKITYKEYYNMTEVKTLEFNSSSSHWKILEACNEQVISPTELESKINDDIHSIRKDIAELVEEGLIYQSDNNMEIISVINTRNLN